MKNKELLIKDLAKEFTSTILQFLRIPNGGIKFKEQLELELINYYDSTDKLTYLYEVHSIITAQFNKHSQKCQYKDTPEMCAFDSLYTRALLFTEQEIGALNPDYNFTFLHPNINSQLLKDNLIALKAYPKAAKQYQLALNKLNESKHERNLLDDLRLSLEILIKCILNNNKSLENQIDEIGSYLKSKGTSAELRNMFITLIKYYCKYQNNYIKHDDLVKPSEIELIVNLSGAFISFLIYE
jgi:hypothetical protein